MFYNLFFSPTGGTKKVAEILGDAMHVEQTIDFTPASVKLDSITPGASDICIISVPSFGGRIPFSATDKLKTFKASGAKAILVTTFGNRAIDDTLLEMKDILTQNGFSCIAAIEAVTEHSFVRKFGAGRPDAQDQTELQSFASIILQRIANPDTAPVEVPGKHPYKDFKGVPFHPAVDETKCVSCGICATRCPAGAIPHVNPEMTLADRCITCMACVVNCPERARNLTNEIFAALEAKLSAVCAERKSNKLY